MTPRILRALTLSALAPACLACGGDGPVDPSGDDPPYVVQLVSGGSQVGLRGQLLADSVRIRLFDPDGVPATGRLLDFTATAGGRVTPARATTRTDGTVAFRWRLGTGASSQVVSVTSPLLDEPFEVAASVAPFPDVDAIAVGGLDDGSPIGVLVDGTSSVGEFDDFLLVGEGPTLGIGDWRGDGAASGEVIVFVPGRTMLHRRPPGFTASPDTVRFDETVPLPIDLTVWLASGNADRANVENALVTTARIFEDEGLGVAIRSVEFVEDVEAPGDLLLFTCPRRAELEAAVGRREGRINVYVVGTVDGSSSRGQACQIGGDFVVLGRFAGHTLLAHEIGHNLSLIHVDGDPEHFDPTNVMHSASDSRDSFSEGQVVRAQLNGGSALNQVWGYHDPSAWRSCFGGSDALCPPTQLRLWADGPFPPFPSPAAVSSSPPASRSLPADAALALVTCGLDAGEPTSRESAEGDAARAPGPRIPRPRLEEMLLEGPPDGLADRWADAARLRAAANARWLARRGRPGWLRPGSGHEATDPTAAARGARPRLERLWRERLGELLEGG